MAYQQSTIQVIPSTSPEESQCMHLLMPIFTSQIGSVGRFYDFDVISDELYCSFNQPNLFYISIKFRFLLLIEILKDSFSCATKGHDIRLTIDFSDDDSVSIVPNVSLSCVGDCLNCSLTQ